LLIRELGFPDKCGGKEDDHEWDHVEHTNVGSHIMGPKPRVASSSFKSCNCTSFSIGIESITGSGRSSGTSASYLCGVGYKCSILAFGWVSAAGSTA